ncbi:MAG: MBL fold metallo-hydrolase RNA specificity domain-containing protein [Candidatus Heimdallarchaeota archaeon]
MNEVYRRYFHDYWVSKKILGWCADHHIEVPFDMSNFVPVNRNLADNLDTFRKMIVSENKPNIILSTSGMLEGGPIHSYLLHGANNPNNLLALSGYQVEETIGRTILDGARKVKLFNWKNKKGTDVDIKAEVRQFQFSGHAQRNELIKMLKAINADQLILVHGTEESSKSMEHTLRSKYTPHIPDTNETMNFED